MGTITFTNIINPHVTTNNPAILLLSESFMTTPKSKKILVGGELIPTFKTFT
jgi:hypothetical protein